MHLKQLKLAGFKSFIDPAIVHFPSQLVAVVGPNGCGKSNIIDAVRWVMGESSAKNLRGESMVDVIFNGSSTRKPLGQAFVELIFDNSLGRLGGAYASYQEIAVKRLVTRGGESFYYLNGSRCRRRDITDLFLGTGAGVKGYSIIGQDTISRMIVAKPEDLRLFLEEAAGVSKYKERRRETLLRIEHTQENLTRVADIIEELNKQLQRLERQAKAAERYNQYKEQEQRYRSEILAFKWQDFMEQVQIKQKELSELSLRYEQQQSQLTSCRRQRILLNEQLQDSTKQSQQHQEAFYQISTQIARLEETLQQKIRDKKRLEEEKIHLINDSHILQELLKQDEEILEACQLKSLNLKEQWDHLIKDFEEQESQWQILSENQNQSEKQWQDIQQSTNALRHELQVCKINKQHLESKKQQIHSNLEKLLTQKAAISLENLLNEREKLQIEASHLKDQHQLEGTKTNLYQDNLHALRQQSQAIVQQLHQVQDTFHKLNSEQAACLAIQKTVKQKNQPSEAGPWANKPRLMELVQVERPWEKALECILGDTLCAYVLDDLKEIEPKGQSEQLVTLIKNEKDIKSFPTLASKIIGDIPVSMHHLQSIFTASNFEEAKSWLPNLLPHESIVLTSGLWLGTGWISFPQAVGTDEVGLLELHQKILDSSEQLPKLQLHIETLTTERDQCQTSIQDLLKDLEQVQGKLAASSKAIQNHSVTLTKVEQQIHQAQYQLEQINTDYENQKNTLEEIQIQLVGVEAQYHSLENQLKEQEINEQATLKDRQTKQEIVRSITRELEQCRSQKHKIELEQQSESIKAQQLKERLFRERERAKDLQERLEHILLQSSELDQPELLLKEQLRGLVAQHEALEILLTACKEQMTENTLALAALEKKYTIYDIDAKNIQELIGQTKLQEQALSLKASAVQEQLAESQLEPQALLQHMPAEINQSLREEALLVITKKIQALGAINLAAIEEFTTEKQRKDYLETQSEDLKQALTALQTAIEQIDKETLARLENTFDEVNTSFKALFPRLFGGGRAQLELTCDNLLEAGIVVMAQPPGKRNSTIHLLSGGEKAMTAVALVFAIFQLNPSPFCMLDEVDAPLDDINVGRFCDLVKEMSQFVQFLFITHNKVTMELADHLIGVTMREPGVSRLVTVDVKLYDNEVNHAGKLELNS